MKLLLDENLSRRLVPALQQGFEGSLHVEDLGLQGVNACNSGIGTMPTLRRSG